MTAGTQAAYQSDYTTTKDIQYLTLTGELRVFFVNISEKMTAL